MDNDEMDIRYVDDLLADIDREERRRRRKKKLTLGQKIRKDLSTYIAIFSITIIIAFTIACFIMQYYTQMEVPATLIEKFYDFFGYELLILGGVKVSKNVKEIFIEKLKGDDEE